MMLKLPSRVKETTSVLGTGSVTLLGAANQSIDFLTGVGDGNNTFYSIEDQNGTNWEIGFGTYTASGNTLSRDTVLLSSNSNALVNFTAGVKNVYVTLPGERAVFADNSGNVNATSFSGSGAGLTGTASGLTVGLATLAAEATVADSLNINNSYTAVAFTTTSDEKVKTNWQPVPLDFIERLAQVKSGIYDRVDQKITQVGVSAQSLQLLMPNAIQVNGNGLLSVNYGNAALVAAIELAKEIQLLKQEIQSLKSRV